MEVDVIRADEVRAGDRVKTHGDFEEVARVHRYRNHIGWPMVAIYFLDTSRNSVQANDLVTRMREGL